MTSDGPGTGPPPPGRSGGRVRPPAGAHPPPLPARRIVPGPVGAGLWPRVGARVLDVLIVAIPLSIVLSLIGWGATAVTDVGGTRGQISGAIQSVLWFAYFVWLESSRGATVGKSLVGIEVQGPDGRPPSVERAIKRNVWMLLGLIPVIGGMLSFAAVITLMITIATGSDFQGIHDEWATTAVLRRP